MNSKFLTTGQAANRLAVTPDTVLKWIRTGRLPARRTPGGHHRIDPKDLEVLASDDSPSPAPAATASRRPFQYCWEFYGNGNLPEQCRGCAVYIMRAHRCYEVAKLAPESGHLKSFCDSTCEDCEYYRLVLEQRTNVLVVTDDPALCARLMNDVGNADFNLAIADCEYDCSFKVSNFRPDFVVVDCAMGQRVIKDVSLHLTQDPRIPSVRVILAGKVDEFPEECDKEVIAQMRRPFGINEIGEIIDGMRGES